jgi:hypothetical protein
MSAVRHWLEAIGLGQYAGAFEANDIDAELLTQIDDQLLKEIGVSSAGHRLRSTMPSPNLPPLPFPKQGPRMASRQPKRPALGPSGGSSP